MKKSNWSLFSELATGLERDPEFAVYRFRLTLLWDCFRVYSQTYTSLSP
jgi:hypothetical protein